MVPELDIDGKEGVRSKINLAENCHLPPFLGLKPHGGSPAGAVFDLRTRRPGVPANAGNSFLFIYYDFEQSSNSSIKGESCASPP